MKRLIVLLGPPAAGKTTIANRILEREAFRQSGSSIVYVSSEMVIRAQIGAILATKLPGVATLDGDQLILADNYRSVLTLAAIKGAISLASTLVGQASVGTVLLEVPESGFDLIEEFSREWSVTAITVIHLDAELGVRHKRNAAREPYARLPSEAMSYFEKNRVNVNLFEPDGSRLGYARISTDRDIAETVDNVLECIHTLTETL